MKHSLSNIIRDAGWPGLAGALFLTVFVAMASSTLFGSTSAAAEFEAPATIRSFADVVEHVSPSVVNIAVTKKMEARPATGFRMQGSRQGQVPFDDFFDRFFGIPGMVPQRSPAVHAEGSGFVIDRDGYVVTNNHVVEGASDIVVVTSDGSKLDAELVGTDPKTDLALLKVDPDKSLPALSFGNSDKARVGDWVLAIGNPFGLGGTATAGIISARGRDIRSGPYDDYLQIDAPINSGNSGGPVFNAEGEVIGVNTAIYSPNGGNVGIGFAIPSKQVKSVIAELEESGTVRRGWLGVQIQDVDQELAGGLGLDKPTGALVAEVLDNSPAGKAGVRVGDIITRFGDADIDTAKSLSKVVAATDPADRVPVRVLRDGESRTMHVKLGEAEKTAQSAPLREAEPGAAGSLGLSLADLDENYRRRLGLPDDYQGVVITAVEPGSSAAEHGLRAGDVISRIGSVPVRMLADAKRAIRAAKSKGDYAALLVRRGDGQQYVSVAFS